MQDELRYAFYRQDPDKETIVRLRRLSEPGKLDYLIYLPGEDSFRMNQGEFGQWKFADRLNTPLPAIHLESELIRVIRENEDGLID